MHITSDRLEFRELTPEHAAGGYLKWMNDPQVTEYLVSGVREYSSEQLKDYIVAQNEDPDVLLMGVFLKKTGSHIGNVKLRGLTSPHRRADLGIVIGDKTLWGNGYATETIRRVTEYAFKKLILHKIEAGCMVNNTGSFKAFLKAGYCKEGLRADQFFLQGQWIDEVLLGITANEECPK